MKRAKGSPHPLLIPLPLALFGHVTAAIARAQRERGKDGQIVL